MSGILPRLQELATAVADAQAVLAAKQADYDAADDTFCLSHAEPEMLDETVAWSHKFESHVMPFWAAVESAQKQLRAADRALAEYSIRMLSEQTSGDHATETQALVAKLRVSPTARRSFGRSAVSKYLRRTA